MRIYIVKENNFGSVVIEILRYKQTSCYFIMINDINTIQWRAQDLIESLASK